MSRPALDHTSALGVGRLPDMKIRYYAKMRLALVVAKRHKRSRRFGWQVLSFQSDNELGLIGLGTVVAPRPFKPWRRDRPNAGGERRR